MTVEEFKKEFDKGMPTITYVKKRYGFQSIDAFEAYVAQLQEKAKKYDELIGEEDEAKD